MKDLSTNSIYPGQVAVYSGTNCMSAIDCTQGCSCVDGQCVPIGDKLDSCQWFSESYLLDLILEGRITVEESRRLKELADSKDQTLRYMAIKLLYETP